MEEKPKRSVLQRFIIVLLLLLVMGLCVGGFLLPGRELPEISISAELLPVHLPLPGFQEGIPNTLPTAALTTLLLTCLALAYYRAQRRAPLMSRNRFLVAVEGIVEGLYSFIESIVGERYAPVFFPLVASFFIFILISNWMGLIPGVGSLGIWEEVEEGHRVLVPLFRAASADISTTLALAIVSVASTQYFGIRYRGVGYLRKYFNFSAPPDSGGLRPLLAIANGFASILELVSEVVKIFSFAFRLFGNIFAGEVVLIIVSFLAAFVVAVPFIGLEVFVGLIQALIFAMLSLIFFSMAVREH